ncbi:MAG TPA: NmrA family transcriptional regulator, partial [Terriglobales bacterium]|nr:NmrA family transcriptional regulator [Terriglobales bacterium]
EATQFFEFLKGLADISMIDGKVHLPPVLFQPMAADDVASGVARVAVGLPLNSTVEIGGPQPFRVDELVRRRLESLKDPREVIADPNATYSGARLSERTLVPGKNAILAKTTFESWLSQPGAQLQRAKSPAA